MAEGKSIKTELFQYCQVLLVLKHYLKVIYNGFLVRMLATLKNKGIYLDESGNKSI